MLKNRAAAVNSLFSANIAGRHPDEVSRIEKIMAAAYTPNPYWRIVGRINRRRTGDWRMTAQPSPVARPGGACYRRRMNRGQVALMERITAGGY